MNGWLSGWTKKRYKEVCKDLCTCFIKRGFSLSDDRSYEALITSDTCMYISSFEKMRKEVIERTSIVCFIDTRGTNAHPGVFDANAGWVLWNHPGADIKGSYFKLNHPISEKGQRLLEALANPDCGWFYRADASGFEAIPGSPIAYWASASTLTAFENPLLGDLIPVKKGLDTGDNDTFLRLWYEVSISKMKIGSNNQQSFVASRAKWAPHDKGGEYRRWYGNKEWIINWENNGSDLKASSANLRSERYYFHNAITWSSLSSGLCSFRLSDYGAISNTAGSSMFPGSDALLYLALMNSSIVQYLLEFLAPTLNYSAGPVGQVPRAEFVNRKTIETLANDSVANAKQDWDAYETSWDFKRHPLI